MIASTPVTMRCCRRVVVIGGVGSGHGWEARYFSTPIDPADRRRLLATLRTIHANPKAAGVRRGFHNP